MGMAREDEGRVDDVGAGDVAAGAALRARRAATVSRIAVITGEFEAVVSACADSNGDDEHDPEGSTIAFERAQVAAVLAQARIQLEDVDRAIARLADGTYLRCEQCGAPIGSKRLAARPTARTCIRCAAAGSR